MSLDRRGALKRLALSLGAFLPKGARSDAATSEARAQSIPGRAGGYIRSGTIEIEHRLFELVVVGGGIAGICAAISAARNGVQVALVHERSTLGGNSSSEVRLYPEDTTVYSTWCRESGIIEEIYTEERARNWVPYQEGLMNSQWDLILYEWVQRERNLTLLLNTSMREVEMADENHIAAVHAVQLGTEKQFVISAPLFVDCSGDGVLIYRSGADFRTGREGRSEYGELLAPEQASNVGMGNTLYFRAVDTGGPAPFKRPGWAAEFPNESDLLTYRYAGDDRIHQQLESGYWWIEVGYPMDWIRDNEAIRDVLLRQVLGVWDHIKNRCPDDKIRERARTYALDFVGFWPYKRESRRLLGDYVLREQDVRDPAPHPDDIAYGVWGIDMHAPGGILERRVPPVTFLDSEFETRGTVPYGIALRSCYSRNVVNLLTAGRPLAASYIAFASSRVLPTGAIPGQAVGVAASLCKKYQCEPRALVNSHAQELQQILLRQDGSIPGVDNRDPRDLARTATVTASSDLELSFPPGGTYFSADFPLAQIFPVSSERLEKVELLLKSSASSAICVRLGLRRAVHAWDFRSDEDIAIASAWVAPGSEGYVPFTFNVHTQAGGLYYVYMEAHPEVAWSLWSDVDGNPSLVPVGVTPARRPGKTKWSPITGGAAFSMRLTPRQRPYAPENIIRGTHRPDRWTNIWISAAQHSLPAWIELELQRRVEFNLVQITFDTNINVRTRRPLYRFPDCVKRYEVAAHVGGSWKILATVDNNYSRRVLHSFPRVRADRVRITVAETNGASTARIYEVRIYDETNVTQSVDSSDSVIFDKISSEFRRVPSEVL